jgi:two-component system, NtrC family, response regulator PilR
MKNDSTWTHHLGCLPQSPIRHHLPMLQHLATSDVSIHISGPSGTGKEVLANLIHRQSSRQNAPCVAVNCGAIPATMVERELFGCLKGAYTGAHQSQQGYIAQAQGGTLFLDEIADLPPNAQSALLRVLQERTVRPLGSIHELGVDFRLLSATSKNLLQEVQQGRFRIDLYYRICSFTFTLPPLRKRMGDMELLASNIWNKHKKRYTRTDLPNLSPTDIFTLKSHTWPGNIRELNSVLENYLLLQELKTPLTQIIQQCNDPLYVLESQDLCYTTNSPPTNQPAARCGKYATKEQIEQALQHCHYNQSATARYLGISRGSLQYKMRKLNIGVC